MARRSDREDPLSGIRRLLRGVRDAAKIADNPVAAELFPGVPPAQRRAALAGMLDIALFRLTPRQRAIVRRYDLDGEPAARIQHSLALSPRQFFRDRHTALARLKDALLPQCVAQAKGAVPEGGDRAHAEVRGAEILRRTLARHLAQSGDASCVRILADLVQRAADPAARADVLLDLAEIATEYDDDATARDAALAVARLLRDGELNAAGRAAYFEGRLAGIRARSAPTTAQAKQLYAHAERLLRRSLCDDPADPDVRLALAETSGDVALLEFNLGSFAQARTASHNAVELIESTGPFLRPRMLEILAMDGALDACSTGRVEAAVAIVTPLLHRAVDSGWYSTAIRLGADLVGLSGVRGDYAEAIRWYERMASLPSHSGRPSDRANLAMEVAHAYTMTGRPVDALTILEHIAPDAGCPRAEAPSWLALTAAALERSGRTADALARAEDARAGYASRNVARGLCDAHRLLAICHAKLGNARAAREHVVEAFALAETFATPYGFLLTLVTKANILGDALLKREALAFALLLRTLGSAQH